MNCDLTSTQKDYAHFLPALSGFYATYIGKQRFEMLNPRYSYVTAWNLRIANKKDGLFNYH